MINEGYWSLIQSIAIPEFVWANLLEPRLLEDNTLTFEWPEELEGMPGLTRVAMVFELWVQWDHDDQARFATKGPIEFGRIEDFCVSGLSGTLAIQWVKFAKHTMKRSRSSGCPGRCRKLVLHLLKETAKSRSCMR